MKKILSIVLVYILSLGFINLNAQQLLVRDCSEKFTTESNRAQQDIKYCGLDIASGIGTGQAVALKAAVNFPAAFMGAYTDAKIVKIKVGLIGEKISNTKVWLASSLTGQRFVEQEFVYAEGWNEVTLTTPYTITAGDLVVGYDAETKSSGNTAQILGVSANKPVNAVNGGNIAIGNDWTTLAANKLDFNLCIIAVIEGDFPEYIDLGIASVNLEKYAKINTDVVVGGSLISSSNVPVTSYDVNYTVNGGEATTINVTNANIAPSATASFKFPAFKFTKAGAYDVKVTVLNVNGDKDKTLENNTMTKTVIAYENSFKRNVVLEHFTTEKCPNCPAAEKNLEKWVGDNPDVIWVSNHCAYYTDPYTLPDASKYTWFFNDGGSTYAPAIMLDQAWLAPDGDAGPVFFPAATYTPTLVKERLNTPAFVDLSIYGSYDQDTKELNINVTGKKILELAGANTVLTVWLTEDNLKSVQAGTLKHNHVLRKVVSKLWGDPIAFDGKDFVHEYASFQLDDKFVPEEMKIVAFLSNYDSKDANNCEVHNGTFVKLTEIISEPGVGVNNIVNELAVSVYPNPAKDVINIDGEYNVLSIIDVTGKVVKTITGQSSVDVRDLNNGIYILNIVGENATKMHKIMIAK